MGIAARGEAVVLMSTCAIGWRSLPPCVGFPTSLAERVFDLLRANSSRRMCLRMSWCSFGVCTLTVLSLLAAIH